MKVLQAVWLMLVFALMGGLAFDAAGVLDVPSSWWFVGIAVLTLAGLPLAPRARSDQRGGSRSSSQ